MSYSDHNQGKSFVAALVLNWFLGPLGVHRFYTGYIGIGVAQLLTFGGCGIWALIDLISICLGNYTDAEGLPLAGYNKNVGMAVLIILGILIVLGGLSTMNSGS